MKPALAFVGTALVGLFVVWCGGYNFDTRNADVATGACVILAASMFAATLIAELE